MYNSPKSVRYFKYLVKVHQSLLKFFRDNRHFFIFIPHNFVLFAMSQIFLTAVSLSGLVPFSNEFPSFSTNSADNPSFCLQVRDICPHFFRLSHLMCKISCVLTSIRRLVDKNGYLSSSGGQSPLFRRIAGQLCGFCIPASG